MHQKFAARLLLAIAGALSSQAGQAAPALTDFFLVTPRVNVNQAPGTVRFRIGVTDDAGGLGNVYLHYVSPHGQSVERNYFFPTPIRAGKFFLDSEPLSRFAETGAWNLEQLQLCDRPAPGQISSCAVFHTADLLAMGFSTGLIVDNALASDAVAPTLLSVQLLNRRVVIDHGTARPSSIRVQFNASDDLSGVVAVGGCLYNNSTSLGFGSPTPAARIGAQNYTAEFYIPPDLAQGIWSLSCIDLRDAAGNVRRIDDPEELQALVIGDGAFEVIWR